MGIRTTVTLDDDVVARLREESRARGVSFRKLLNDAIRSGLQGLRAPKPRRKFKMDSFKMGVVPGLDYNNVHALIDLAEGEQHR